MDLFETGDPYVEWEELNSVQETNNEEGENDMEDFNLEGLKADVVKMLVTDFDMTMDEAATSVEESYRENSDLWNSNAVPWDLAKFLASEGDDD